MSTSRISDTARRTVGRIAGFFDRMIGERASRPAPAPRGTPAGEGTAAARGDAAPAAGRPIRFAPDDTQ